MKKIRLVMLCLLVVFIFAGCAGRVIDSHADNSEGNGEAQTGARDNLPTEIPAAPTEVLTLPDDIGGASGDGQTEDCGDEPNGIEQIGSGSKYPGSKNSDSENNAQRYNVLRNKLDEIMDRALKNGFLECMLDDIDLYNQAYSQKKEDDLLRLELLWQYSQIVSEIKEMSMVNQFFEHYDFYRTRYTLQYIDTAWKEGKLADRARALTDSEAMSLENGEIIKLPADGTYIDLDADGIDERVDFYINPHKFGDARSEWSDWGYMCFLSVNESEVEQIIEGATGDIYAVKMGKEDSYAVFLLVECKEGINSRFRVFCYENGEVLDGIIVYGAPEELYTIKENNEIVLVGSRRYSADSPPEKWYYHMEEGFSSPPYKMIMNFNVIYPEDN